MNNTESATFLNVRRFGLDVTLGGAAAGNPIFAIAARIFCSLLTYVSPAQGTTAIRDSLSVRTGEQDKQVLLLVAQVRAQRGLARPLRLQVLDLYDQALALVLVLRL